MNIIKWFILITILSISLASFDFNLDEELKIYKEYEIVYKIFKKRINNIIRSKATGNTSAGSVMIDIPYLKSPYSYRRKFFLSEKKVNDLIRCMVVFENEEEIFDFVKILKRVFWTVRQKIHFNTQRYKVYQMLVNLKLFPGYNIEIQLILKNSYIASKSSHDIYKILRSLFIVYKNFYNDFFYQKFEVVEFYKQSFLPFYLLVDIEKSHSEISMFEIFLYEICNYINNINDLDKAFKEMVKDITIYKLKEFSERVENYLFKLYKTAYEK